MASDKYGLRFNYRTTVVTKALQFDPILRCGGALVGPLGGPDLEKFLTDVEAIAKAGDYEVEVPAPTKQPPPSLRNPFRYLGELV